MHSFKFNFSIDFNDRIFKSFKQKSFNPDVNKYRNSINILSYNNPYGTYPDHYNRYSHTRGNSNHNESNPYLNGPSNRQIGPVESPNINGWGEVVMYFLYEIIVSKK